MRHKRTLPSLTQWHRWLGLTLSLWLIVMAVTGSVLLYKNELLSWQYPQLQLEQPLTHDQVAPVVDQFDNGYALMPTQGRPWLEVVNSDNTHFYYNAEGTRVLQRPHLSDAISWMVELHHHLLLDELGEDLLGIIGLLSLVLITTGLIRWWPKHARFRRALSVRFFNPFSKRGSQTLWQLHRLVGVALFLPVALSLVTGTAIMYAGPVKSALITLLPDSSAEQPTTSLSAQATTWSERLTLAEQALPGADPRLLYLQKPRIRAKHADEWHPNGRNYVSFSDSGQVTQVIDERRTPLGNRLSNMIYPTHAGSIGGALYTFVVLLAGIGLMVLPLTGLWFYSKRSQLKRT